MCEGLGGRAAAAAGGIGEITPPGGVGGEIAFACSHLVNSSGDELVEIHERVRGEARCVGVVFGSGVKRFPVFQKWIPCPPFEGAVRHPHELGWGDVGSW